MALSGNISVPVSEHTTLAFLWVATQNVQTNSSDVAWEMQLVTDDIGNIQATPGSAYRVTVDGQQFNGTTDVSIGTNSTKTLASGVVTIVHNADGNRGFDFSFEQDFYITIVTTGEYVGFVSGSGTGVLDTITAGGGDSGGDSGETPEPEEPEEPDVPDEPEVPDASVIANRKRSTIIGYLLDLVGNPLPLASNKPTGGYLTFASVEPFTIGVNNATKNWDGVLEYSTDTAVWNEWDGATPIASAEHGGEHKVYMRGSGNTRIMPNSTSSTTYNMILTGSNIRCVGNIENLLDYETVANGGHPIMAKSCYERMFYGCTGLVTAPELPATILTESCYESMFQDCTGLLTAPALPATTLAERCYYRMFDFCKSLVNIPSLPAIELTKECYSYMFSYCKGLKLSKTQSEEYPNEYRIPASGAGTNGTWSLVGMFDGTGGETIGKVGTPEINTTYYAANDVVPYE